MIFYLEVLAPYAVAPTTLLYTSLVSISICDNARTLPFLTLEVVLSHLQQSMDAELAVSLNW